MKAKVTTDLVEAALDELNRGNFTRLDELLRGRGVSIFEILDGAGNRQEDLDEAFTWACMLGRVKIAEKLLDSGASPAAGMKTGLAGAHYAASGGHLDVVRMLIRRGVSLETRNIYGGTVLGQALWSAIHEPRDLHADVIEAVTDAGALIEPGTLEWWEEQDVPSPHTKARVTKLLSRHQEE